MKTEYTPDYPKSKKDAIEMMQDMHDEDDTNTDFMNGYRMGLRIGIGILKTLIIREDRRKKMREIKFRGIDNGEWVHGNLSLQGNQAFIEPFADLLSRIEVILETVGQFTGLLDKNGKEIYAGDIVKMNRKIRTGTQKHNERRGYYCTAINEIKDIIGEVKIGNFENGLYKYANVAFVDVKTTTQYEHYFFGEGKRTDRPSVSSENHSEIIQTDNNYEVIGNIHENGELLKGGERWN